MVVARVGGLGSCMGTELQLCKMQSVLKKEVVMAVQ